MKQKNREFRIYPHFSQKTIESSSLKIDIKIIPNFFKKGI